MGKESKDAISFPLSDSWRMEKDRINDCTYRIKKLLERINKRYYTAGQGPEPAASNLRFDAAFRG
ncbi:MAG TPA: hypothetical protein DEQ14_00830 [Treponema sp.]|nr:hypothetical protein [Treponema sp.]